MGNDEEFRKLIREELQRAIKDALQEKPQVSEPDDKIDNLENYVKDTNFESQTPDVTKEISISPTPNPVPPPEPSNDGSAGELITPPVPEPPPPTESEGDEWQKYEKSQYNMSEYLESEWDHKSWMLATKFFDKDVIKLHELVLKELSLSNIPDAELAFIYSIKMDCIEEWLSMGLVDLAKQRLVHMLFRLRLLTSIDGLELVGQHGTSAISMSMDRPEFQRQAMEDEQEQQNRPKLGLSAITNRLKRATK